jgi:hypothetical protein
MRYAEARSQSASLPHPCTGASASGRYKSSQARRGRLVFPRKPNLNRASIL